MIATVGSFLTIKLLLLPPLYSLQVGSLADMVNLGLFLVAASVVSLINSQVHAQAEASEINEWRMQALLQVYKIALHARSRNEALAELHANLKQFLHAEIAVYMPSLVMPNLQAVWPQEPNLNEQDLAILNQAWDDAQSGSDHEASNPHTGWRFEPLTSANGEIGMLALRVPAAETTDVHFKRYLHMVAELVASILEKIESTDMKEETRVRDEREKLRTSLLSSVSHDLKTPLAAILGSLSVHRSMYDKLPEPQRRELTDAALAEAQRLDSFITNILDLAKIESGAVKFKRQWQPAEDLVSRVKKRMRMRFEHHELILVPSAATYEVELDPVTSEQALLNVLDNAIKYTEAGSTIEVSMDADDRYFRLQVRDHGRGIPEEDHERIFDKYTRLQRQDHQVAGTGLGLALSRAVMRGQGGDITVATHPDGGAIFTLCWPHWRIAGKVSKSA
jgi:two-component system sensor histidine kinase KdpD